MARSSTTKKPNEPSKVNLLNKVREYKLNQREKTILRLLISARYDSDLTQPQAAKLTGLKLYRIRFIEQGKARYAYNNLAYIHWYLNCLGCTLDFTIRKVVDYKPLFGREPDEPKKK